MITMFTVTRTKGNNDTTCHVWGRTELRSYNLTDSSLARIERVATYKRTRRYDTRNACGTIIKAGAIIETSYTF